MRWPGCHHFDWQRHLPDWQAPCALRDEIERWDPILAKSPEPRWIEAGLRTRERLLATLLGCTGRGWSTATISPATCSTTPAA